MVTLSVISAAGATPASEMTERFTAPGGTIGRAPGNQLVLPDTERSVSRVHVRIQFRGSGPRAVCVGANAVMVNGTTLEQGEEVALDDGDRLQIGSFLLKASVTASK